MNAPQRPDNEVDASGDRMLARHRASLERLAWRDEAATATIANVRKWAEIALWLGASVLVMLFLYGVALWLEVPK